MNEAPDLQYGHAIRPLWGLDWSQLTVNHGSYGAAPLPVLAEQSAWRARMEAQPTIFMQTVLPEALRASATALAGFLGAEGQDLAFVENATTGVTAVLTSLPWRAGDEIVMLTHGYNAVRQTVRHMASRTGVVLVEAAVPFPHPDDAVIIGNILAAITVRTRLVIVDHITSPSALVLPLAGIIAACHAHGVPVLVDGAHGPGLLPLDLTALDADWYTGNCHKWLMAPKGAAFLWANPKRHETLHPTIISHGYGKGFIAEFDWTGTRDPSAWLSVPAAIAFHHQLGGTAMMARNKSLALQAAENLATRFGTELAAAPHQHAAMAMVRLPHPGEMTIPRMLIFRHHLMTLGCDAQLSVFNSQLWLRISAAAYNAAADFERLGNLLQGAWKSA